MRAGWDCGRREVRGARCEMRGGSPAAEALLARRSVGDMSLQPGLWAAGALEGSGRVPG